MSKKPKGQCKTLNLMLFNDWEDTVMFVAGFTAHAFVGVQNLGRSLFKWIIQTWFTKVFTGIYCKVHWLQHWKKHHILGLIWAWYLLLGVVIFVECQENILSTRYWHRWMAQCHECSAFYSLPIFDLSNYRDYSDLGRSKVCFWLMPDSYNMHYKL